MGPANIGSRAPVVEGAGNCAESRGATGLDLGKEAVGARAVDRAVCAAIVETDSVGALVDGAAK